MRFQQYFPFFNQKVGSRVPVIPVSDCGPGPRTRESRLTGCDIILPHLSLIDDFTSSRLCLIHLLDTMPRRFSVRAVSKGFAYRLRHHPSFYVSVIAHLICATATVGFILAFIQQASYTGNTRRFNIVIIAALLGAVLFTSCFLILARIIAVRTSFNTIPKPYIPTKHIDVPRKVAEHITREYTRTGVIAYISQPTAGKQEGWGRPGTQFASIHFRKSIRETFHAIRKSFPLQPRNADTSFSEDAR